MFISSSCSRRGLLALASVYAAVLASFGSPGRAQASCRLPPPELVWSYPSQGANDVPTNAVFMFLSPVSVTGVELNGQAVPAQEIAEHASARMFVPDELDPHTPYTLTVTFAASDVEQVPAPFEVSFETGSGPRAGHVAAIELLAISEAEDAFSSACQKVIQAQDCYDEGQDTNVLLEVEGEALAYVVTRRHGPDDDSYMSSVFWPASCGAPSVYFYADASACYTVHGVDELGQVRASQELCGAASDPQIPPADDDQGSSSGGSCSARTARSDSPVGLSLSALLLAAWIVRRRGPVR